MARLKIGPEFFTDSRLYIYIVAFIHLARQVICDELMNIDLGDVRRGGNEYASTNCFPLEVYINKV